MVTVGALSGATHRAIGPGRIQSKGNLALRRFKDRRLCNFETEHQQLTVNPGHTPLWVFAIHPPDQVTQAPIDFRPPYPVSGLPPPKHPKTRAAPSKNGLRLNQPGHTDQADQVRPELGHHYEQRAVTTAQSKCDGARRSAMLS